MADATQMTDEELKKVIETGIEPESPEAPVEETPEEPETPAEDEEVEKPEAVEEEPNEETPEEPEAPEEPQPSRREQLRINQLLAKYGDPGERQPAPKSKADDYIKTLDADPEVIEQLEASRQAASDAAYFEGLRQSEVKDWKRDLKYEAPLVEKDFPFLNPKDEANFKPAAAQAMNQKYLRFIGYDPGDAQKGVSESIRYPDVSYREFIESEMEFVDELASQKVAQTTKNIAKQVATTGLRPDGSSAKRLNLNQSEKDMSMEELYAAIGQTPPTK